MYMCLNFFHNFFSEPQKVQSGSDSDDDIQFVSKSFDPNKRQQPQQVVVRTVG